MYLLYKIKIKFISCYNIINNSTYMYAGSMILYSFEREERDLSIKLKIAFY